MSHSFCKANSDDLLGYRIKLYPSEAQKEILNKQIRLFRYVYNWALEVEHNNYNDDKENSHFLQEREMYDRFKNFRNKPENEWLKELPLNSARHAILKVLRSFRMFFDRKNRYPHFKSRKHGSQFFCVRGERLRLFDEYVHIEGFKKGDNILCKKHNAPKGRNQRYYACTISFDGYDYWLSFTHVAIEPMEFRFNTTEGIGIDLGLRKLAVLSNGKEYKLPNLDKLEKRHRRQARVAMRDINHRREIANQTRTKFEDVNPSKGMIKRAKELRKTTNKMTNIRKTYIHTMTKEIVSLNPNYIVIETLNVKGMLKNKYLAKKISESCFYTIGKQLEYKSRRRGIPLIKAPIDFPSTQLCHNCGAINKVGARETYKCSSCGLKMDRDLNAAINLKNYYNSTI